jgi:riboflavin biosynthesis pyrimidine reductase
MIVNVMASSVDGYVAAHRGQSDAERHEQGFTSHEDWNQLQELIRDADAILLGSQTMIAANGALQVQRSDGTYPIWITFTNTGIPPDTAFWNQVEIPRWIISREPVPMHGPGVRNMVYGDRDLVTFTQQLLKEHQLEQTLLFGGGVINRLFYAAAAVDELIVTICPVLVANKAGVPLIEPELQHSVKLALKSVKQHGDMLFVRYLIKN